MDYDKVSALKKQLNFDHDEYAEAEPGTGAEADALNNMLHTVEHLAAMIKAEMQAQGYEKQAA